jgi:hypothetical protein
MVLLQLLNTVVVTPSADASAAGGFSPSVVVSNQLANKIKADKAAALSEHAVKASAWKLATQCCDDDVGARPKLFQVQPAWPC